MKQWVGSLSIAALASGVGVAVNIATSSSASALAWVVVAGLTVLSGGVTYWLQREGQANSHHAPTRSGRATSAELESSRLDLYRVNPGVASMPPDIISFHNRKHEMQIVTSLLNGSPEGRAILVTGVAGIGKTALALRAAYDSIRNQLFPGGALYANMQGYDGMREMSAAQALDRFLRALGISGEQIPPRLEERSALYRSVVSEWATKGRGLLVIIDNVSTTRQVLPLLPSIHDKNASQISAIITSRHSLRGIEGARLLELDLLDDLSAEQIVADELDSASPGDPRLQDRTSLLKLVRLCDRLPLALKVVSAMLVAEPELPLTNVISGLTNDETRLDSLELAEEGPAVRSALDLSYKMLSSSEQKIFALLSIIPGQVISTDSAAVLTELQADQMRLVLRGLRRAHLLQAGVQYDTWRFHDLTRIFSVEILRRDFRDDTKPATNRMLTEYLRKAQLASRQLNPRIPDDAKGSPDFSSREDAVKWFDIEKENLIASTRIAMELQRYQDTCDLAEALTGYFDLRKMWQEWLDTHRAALGAAQCLADRALQAKIYNHLGIAYAGLMRYGEAFENYQMALDMRHQLGDYAGEGRTRSNMGRVYLAQRSIERAFAEYGQALNALKRANDRFGQSQVLRNLGEAYLVDGQFGKAHEVLGNALHLVQNINDRYGEGIIFSLLAETCVESSQVSESVQYYERSLEIRRALDDAHGEAQVMTDLGAAYASLGETGKGIDLLERSAHIFREIEAYSGLGYALTNLAKAYAKRADLDQAIAVCEEGLSQYRRAGDQLGQGLALTGLGDLWSQDGNTEAARSAWSKADSIFHEIRADREHEKLRARMDALERDF
jgi:tetratricopeptide (TPR) repeat protein